MSTDPKHQELEASKEMLESVTEATTQEVSRRFILKALVAGGGVAASSLLPEQWSKPLVGVGALPVHAQMSGTVPTEEPTAEPLYTLEWMQVGIAEQPEQSVNWYATDLLITTAGIAPAAANIELRVTVTVLDPEHPQYNQVVFTGTRLTDAMGVSAEFLFDLGTLSPLLTPGYPRTRVEWTFVNPSDGTSSIYSDDGIDQEPT